jgi:hypothetical protein
MRTLAAPESSASFLGTLPQNWTLRIPVFAGELVSHFREHELIDRGDEGKSDSLSRFSQVEWSTRPPGLRRSADL